MSEKESRRHGYLVVRRGRPAGEPFEAGDVVDVYPFTEPLAFVADSGTAQTLTAAHEDAYRLGEVIASSRRLRTLGSVDCDCKGARDPRRLARLVQDGRGTVWIVPAREKVPSAFRSDDRDAEPPAWPLHSHGDAPHVCLVSCRACGGRYALGVTANGVVRSRISGARHGRVVVD